MMVCSLSNCRGVVSCLAALDVNTSSKKLRGCLKEISERFQSWDRIFPLS